MTRGGGRGSSPGRKNREPAATREGWAPLAPPREAPVCLGPRPLRARRARLRRVAAAAAAAMSPGKPGAGGAGTRRTDWRRRRRRRRLEAETRTPGFGHTAGRVPDTFQGAQGMKPAARETRTPPRSFGLRWALLPQLLLLSLGQVSLRVGLGVWWEGAGRIGIPCTCPCVTGRRITRQGAERSGSWDPSSWRGLAGILALLPLPPPSLFPGCRVPGEGRDPRAPRVFPWCPQSLCGSPRLGCRRRWPCLSLSWSHLASAGPALAPDAAGGGVFAEGCGRGAGPAWLSRGRPPTRLRGPRRLGRQGSGGTLVLGDRAWSWAVG